MAPAPPPHLNVEAPLAGAFAAGVFSAPPNPEKVEGAVVTAGVAAAAPKLKVEAVVLAGAPKVKVELGADVVTGAPKAGGAPDAPKVGAEVVAILKLDLAVLPYAGGGAPDAVVVVGADEPNVNVEVAVEAGAEVVVEAPKVKVEPGAAGAAAPNVKVEVPVLGTLVVTEPNPDKLFGSVEVADPNEKLGFEVEVVDSEPKLKVVEAVVVAVEDVPNDVEGGDFVTDDVVLATLAVEVVEAAPNEKLGGCGLFVASGDLKVIGATLAVLSLSLSLPKLKLIIF